MRVLVTGATGFVGRHLVRKLIARGDAVHALVRTTSDVSVLPVETQVHRFDGDTAGLRHIVAVAAPDAIVHLASLFRAEHRAEDVVPMVTANVLFATQLVDAATDLGYRDVLNIGTTWQHYRDAAYDPVSLYAASKQAFEAVLAFYVQARGLRLLTLKLNDTYGPDDPRGKLIATLLRAARSGEALALSPGEQVLDLMHVDDAVAAILVGLARLRASDGKAESFVALSGEQLSLRDLVARVEGVTGRKLNIAWGARPYRAREVMRPWGGGVPLPGWRAKVPLEAGLKALAEHV